MKCFFAILAIYFSCVLTGCVSDEPVIIAESSFPCDNDNYKISLSGALRSADELMNKIYKRPLTRTNSNDCTISVVRSKSLTRRINNTEIPDTLLYIVNYNDNQGFAVLSADQRTLPVYAISDNGSIDLNDTVYNEGLDLFFKNVYNDMYLGITNPPIDSLQPVEIPHIVEVLSSVGPIMRSAPQNWGQKYPFNKYCPLNYGTGILPKVGCNAVSLAQVISCSQPPEKIGSIENIDWNYICSWGGIVNGNEQIWPDEVCRILAELGRPEYLNISYDFENSIGDTDRQRTTLIALGYDDPGIALNFPEGISSSSYPLLMRGCEKYPNGSQSLLHTWVIDGYSSLKITDRMFVDCFAYETLYHCVWGWNGKCNGYFAWTNNGLGGQPLMYNGKPYAQSVSVENQYNFNLKYWGNINRK